MFVLFLRRIRLLLALLLPIGLLAGYVGRRATQGLSDADYFTWYRIALSVGAVLMIYRGLTAGG